MSKKMIAIISIIIVVVIGAVFGLSATGNMPAFVNGGKATGKDVSKEISAAAGKTADEKNGKTTTTDTGNAADKTEGKTAGEAGTKASASEPLLKREVGKGKFSLLQDRLTICMPDGTITMKMQMDAASAQPSDEIDTTLILAADKSMVSIYATEALYFCSGNLVKDAKILFGENPDAEAVKNTYSEVKKVNGLEMIEVQPKKIVKGKGSPIIKSAVIRTSDNALIVIHMSTTSDLIKNSAECAELANKIFSTIEPGARKLALEAGVQKLGENISIIKGKNYVFYTQKGTDFDVYYLQEMVACGRKSATMGVYIGKKPSTELEAAEEETIAGKVLGLDVKWISHKPLTGKANDTYKMETVFDSPVKDKINIFMSAADATKMDVMKKMAESITVVK